MDIYWIFTDHYFVNLPSLINFRVMNVCSAERKKRGMSNVYWLSHGFTCCSSNFSCFIVIFLCLRFITINCEYKGIQGNLEGESSSLSEVI